MGPVGERIGAWLVASANAPSELVPTPLIVTARRSLPPMLSDLGNEDVAPLLRSTFSASRCAASATDPQHLFRRGSSPRRVSRKRAVIYTPASRRSTPEDNSKTPIPARPSPSVLS